MVDIYDLPLVLGLFSKAVAHATTIFRILDFLPRHGFRLASSMNIKNPLDAPSAPRTIVLKDDGAIMDVRPSRTRRAGAKSITQSPSPAARTINIGDPDDLSQTSSSSQSSAKQVASQEKPKNNRHVSTMV